jgi:hypothetical protein
LLLPLGIVKFKVLFNPGLGSCYFSEGLPFGFLGRLNFGRPNKFGQTKRGDIFEAVKVG